MRTITLIMALLALSMLLSGCGESKVTPPSGSQTQVLPPAAQATEADTLDEFENTLIEDKDLDLGELI